MKYYYHFGLRYSEHAQQELLGNIYSEYFKSKFPAIYIIDILDKLKDPGLMFNINIDYRKSQK